MSSDDVRKRVAILNDGSLPITRMEFQNLREDINAKFVIVNTSFAEAKQSHDALNNKFDEMNGKLSQVLEDKRVEQQRQEKKEGRRWELKTSLIVALLGLAASVAGSVILSLFALTH